MNPSQMRAFEERVPLVRRAAAAWRIQGVEASEVEQAALLEWMKICSRHDEPGQFSDAYVRQGIEWRLRDLARKTGAQAERVAAVLEKIG